VRALTASPHLDNLQRLEVQGVPEAVAAALRARFGERLVFVPS
jgi:hypothetical protein